MDEQCRVMHVGLHLFVCLFVVHAASVERPWERAVASNSVPFYIKYVHALRAGVTLIISSPHTIRLYETS